MAEIMSGTNQIANLFYKDRELIFMRETFRKVIIKNKKIKYIIT